MRMRKPSQLENLLKLTTKMCLLSLLFLLFVVSPVLASSTSGGLVTLQVSVSGLPDNGNRMVKAVKEIDGVLTVFTAATDANGLASVLIPFGGTAEVTCEPVSGFITPKTTVNLTRIKGNFFFPCSLIYLPDENIRVTGLTVIPAQISNMLAGSTSQLKAVIEPANASVQDVIWESTNAESATVDDKGFVAAMHEGMATIKATSVDGSYVAECTIEVVDVTSLPSMEPIQATPGSTVLLPTTITVELSNGSSLPMSVTWSLAAATDDLSIIASGDAQYVLLDDSAFGDYLLTGSIHYSTLQVSLTLAVSGESSVPIETASFEPASLSLYLGLDRDAADLALVVIPEMADTSALIWSNSNPAVAIIESISVDRKSAVIRGLSNGYAAISVSLPGRDPLDSCLVAVTADPLLTDPAYIAATTESDPTPVDQFYTADEVWIRCYNLPSGQYHLKVTDKGTGLPLGFGTVAVDCQDPDGEGPMPAMAMYHLKSAANFILTTSYSAAYFVYMSTDSDFPTGDDEETGLPRTFMDNFKIGSPVPTGSVIVNVRELIGGIIAFPESLVGKHVILGREIKTQTILETDYDDYLLSMNGDEPVFSDEAKLIGHILADGSVDWLTPKEKLKIGGYVLCLELPEGFSSNLNKVDPSGEDGELVKEVHIKRNTSVEKLVIVWQ